MESLQDILGTKSFTPPDEMEMIKDYVMRRYKSPANVRIEKNAIIVSVPSPTLAASIHLERQSLIKSCKINKRLVIRARQ